MIISLDDKGFLLWKSSYIWWFRTCNCPSFLCEGKCLHGLWKTNFNEDYGTIKKITKKEAEAMDKRAKNLKIGQFLLLQK